MFSLIQSLGCGMGKKKIGYWLKEGKAKRIEISKIEEILARKYDCGKTFVSLHLIPLPKQQSSSHNTL